MELKTIPRNPPLNVRMLPKALKELREITIHIARDSTAMAERISENIAQRIEQLGESPNIGKHADNEDLALRGVRTIGVSRYLVFYQVTETEILVHHIRHSARKEATWRDMSISHFN